MDLGTNQNTSRLDSLMQSHYEESNIKKASDDKKQNLFILILTGVYVWIMDSIQILVIALAGVILLNLFVFSVNTVDGPSMEPNFCNGDVVLIDKLRKSYTYNDVIIFQYGSDGIFIKRIIALPGDKIKLEKGHVYLNNEKLNEPYIPQDRMTNLNSSSHFVEGREYIVPEKSYFVLGDNREVSKDSRIISFVNTDEHEVYGKVLSIGLKMFDKNSMLPVDNCK